MSNVLNRTTKQFLRSANTPDYPTVDWIHNPDLSAVAGQPSKYWIITGDVVTLMDSAAMAVVDAAEAQSLKDALEAETQVGALKAVIAGLVDVMNTKLAANKQITFQEVKAAIKARL